MCGIWVYLKRIGAISKIKKGELYEAFMKMVNRGPDMSNFTQLTEYGITIGFHRLAIMDTSARGHQPFVIDKGDKVVYVICNGEIYDFETIKEKHQIQTKSKSDCEILPYLYEKIGVEGMLREISGTGSEFACTIIDIDKITKEVVIYASRDSAGVRPMFISYTDDEIVFSSEVKGSPFLATELEFSIDDLKPGQYLRVSNMSDKLFSCDNYKVWYDIEKNEPTIVDLEEAKDKLYQVFEKCVESRLHADRTIGFLLSGGLDSSSVVGIAKKIYDKHQSGTEILTFSIGMEDGSTDKEFALKVSEFVGSKHVHFTVTKEQCFEIIPLAIEVIESWDSTSVRASTMQLLLMKLIATHYPHVKVILNGDGSDEIFGGYMYFHNAPSLEEFREDTVRLHRELHKYDVKRVDRTISYNGIEARTPFLAQPFVDLVMQIDTKLKYTKDESGNRRIEKWLFREAMKKYNVLPLDVVDRQKEAFSDGVSSDKKGEGWFEYIQRRVKDIVSDKEYEEFSTLCSYCQPMTKEAMYYRKIFCEVFGYSEQVSKIIPHTWLPKWSGDIHEPSARVLTVY